MFDPQGKDRPVHRRRQSVRHGQGAGRRYRLRNLLAASSAALLRAFYYTALVEDQEYSPIRPLIDWLDYNGFTVVTKPAKEFTDADGPPQGQGQHGHRAGHRHAGARRRPRPCRAVLRRRRLPRAGRGGAGKGVRVTWFRPLTTRPPMIADELRRQADHFIDLSRSAR